MSEWKPLWEARPDKFESLRRVIMAGYYRESGQSYAKVGEAYWGSPDGNMQRWIWSDGGDVVNPLGFQDLPDFPIADENTIYTVGRNI